MTGLRLLPAALALVGAASAAVVGGPEGPRAIVDLSTAEGQALVQGQWRYHDIEIARAEFLAPGPDGQPGTAKALTYDYAPKAGAADFDDATWEVLPPGRLSERKGGGRLSFGWSRINITVPDRIDGYDTTGSTLIFETSIDDYAEIWIDGELTRSPGQSGGSVVAGWNAPNRLVIARGAVPGRKIQLAVFGANGPLSNPPTNYVWMRSAKLELHPGTFEPEAIPVSEVNVDVIRLDPAIDRIVPRNPKLFKLADGFRFTEGPVWLREGALLFSDPNSNRIYKYEPEGKLSVFLEPSGYDGADIAEYGQPGSNGLALDPQGRLTINQHGNHAIAGIDEHGGLVRLVDSYQGKRLNSPNDLVYRSDGALFFTDPPFGLPKFGDDPRKELPYSGVFLLSNGDLKLLNNDLTGPNGIAFTPDEKQIYVGNWDPQRKVVMRYDVADGTFSNPTVFADLTPIPGEDAIDGVKVDSEGNVYVSGPGGLQIYSAAGKHLGTVIPPKHPHNFAWGGEDGRTLYMTARSGLYRMPLLIPGSSLRR
jgi:gluconolactonase